MTKIVLNYSGVKSLLKSNEMKSICDKKAKEIAHKCGNGYSHDTYVGRNRVNASVGAETRDAMLDNSENNTLLKNMR